MPPVTPSLADSSTLSPFLPVDGMGGVNEHKVESSGSFDARSRRHDGSRRSGATGVSGRRKIFETLPQKFPHSSPNRFETHRKMYISVFKLCLSIRHMLPLFPPPFVSFSPLLFHFERKFRDLRKRVRLFRDT